MQHLSVLKDIENPRRWRLLYSSANKHVFTAQVEQLGLMWRFFWHLSGSPANLCKCPALLIFNVREIQEINSISNSIDKYLCRLALWWRWEPSCSVHVNWNYNYLASNKEAVISKASQARKTLHLLEIVSTSYVVFSNSVELALYSSIYYIT